MRTLDTGGDQRAKWYHGWGWFSEYFSAQKTDRSKVFYGDLCCGRPLRQKDVWSLIYRYVGRGISRAAGGYYRPRELDLYGHVSGACQGRGQIENYTVEARHLPIRLHGDD